MDILRAFVKMRKKAYGISCFCEKRIVYFKKDCAVALNYQGIPGICHYFSLKDTWIEEMFPYFIEGTKIKNGSLCTIKIICGHI